MPTTNAETDAHSCAMIPDQIVRTFNIECTYPSSDMSDVNVATSGTYIAMSTWSINPSWAYHRGKNEKLLTHSWEITINDTKHDDAGQAIQSNHAQNEYAARKRRSYG
jgi:hypothetical protein